MTTNKVWINFDCPHCGKSQTRGIFRNAEIETVCDQCKKSIGIVTNSQGDPTRIGQLTSLSNLLKPTNEKIQHTVDQIGMHRETSSINIGNVYGNISLRGDVNVTNIYNETINLIDKAKISDEQKLQAKGLLMYAKDNAPNFLVGVAEIIKMILGSS